MNDVMLILQRLDAREGTMVRPRLDCALAENVAGAGAAEVADLFALRWALAKKFGLRRQTEDV